MASFMEDLWNSIFVPGTTPTLLIATNVSFGALQVVLGLLLFFTSSIHFAVLSFLCAGLWWGVNWFAAELRKAEAAEEEAGRLRKQRSGMRESQMSAEGDDEAEDDETETETEARATGREEEPSKIRIRGGPQKILGVQKSAAAARAARGEDPLAGTENLSASRSSLGVSKDETGSVSTDSEWEKVSDER